MGRFSGLFTRVGVTTAELRYHNKGGCEGLMWRQFLSWVCHGMKYAIYQGSRTSRVAFFSLLISRDKSISPLYAHTLCFLLLPGAPTVSHVAH
jgi:hypothetical protein